MRSGSRNALGSTELRERELEDSGLGGRGHRRGRRPPSREPRPGLGRRRHPLLSLRGRRAPGLRKDRETRRSSIHKVWELPARWRVGGCLLFPLGLSFMNGPGSEHRAPCLLLSL